MTQRSSKPSVITRRSLLQGTAALTASAILSGCGGGSPSAAVVQSPNPQPTPTGLLVSGTVSVSATAVGTVGFGFGGLAPEKPAMVSAYTIPGTSTGGYRLTDASNKDSVGLHKTLAPNGGIMRLGGNGTDGSVWTPGGAGETSGQIAPSDVDALAGFLSATGYKVLYGINLGGSGANASTASKTTSTLAAEEALYVVNKLGIYDPVKNPSGLLYALKLGNEPDLWANYSTSPYYGQTWNESVYETVWTTYRNAILAAVPNAPIAAPALGDAYLSGWPSSASTPWISTFLANQGKNIPLYTCHYYRTNTGANPTPATLLSADSYLTGELLPTLKSAASAAGVPFAMTECASVGDEGENGVSNTYAAALWTVDFLFDCALGGASFVAFESGGPSASANYGLGYNYYSPIQDFGGVVQDIQSEYYGIQFFNLAGQGTLYQTAISASPLSNMNAYAIKTAQGGLNVIVQNKESDPLQLTISLPQSYTSATLFEMTQSTSGATTPDITATSGITIQGAGVAIDGTYSPNAPYIVEANGSKASFYVPALSSVLLKFS